MERELQFMQDNAPGHADKLTKELLATLAVIVINWPPYSPDLNPIETLWKHMKVSVQTGAIALVSWLMFFLFRSGRKAGSYLLASADDADDAGDADDAELAKTLLPTEGVSTITIRGLYIQELR
jgi:hypothetical protein